MLHLTRNVRNGSTLSRREWLRAGGISLGGLSLAELLRRRDTRAAAPGQDPTFGAAKSCIVCFLFGAPAHQDIWDLKPNAPAEVRGEFQPIASSLPGLQLGEHVPRIAGLAHQFLLARSVAHPDNTHTVAMHYMLTGRRHLQPSTNPQNQPTDFPTFGAVMQYLRRNQSGMPAGISLNSPANQVSANNHIFPGFFAGWLGDEYDPLFISKNPAEPGFSPFDGVMTDATDRLKAIDGMLRRMDEPSAALLDRNVTDPMKSCYERAFRLLTSGTARNAMDLAQEPDAVRDRYGRNSFGQAALLARRLVEGGVSLVTINWARDDAFWDTHSQNFKLLKSDLLPPFDLGFSALLEDLAQRGLLDSTLVVCLGEFGRTPKINGAAGRDHWAPCNSVVLAGGGMRKGFVYGASDRQAAYPADLPVSPDDLAATIYHALGVDPHLELHDALGRPLPLTQGRVVKEWFA